MQRGLRPLRGAMKSTGIGGIWSESRRATSGRNLGHTLALRAARQVKAAAAVAAIGPERQPAALGRREGHRFGGEPRLPEADAQLRAHRPPSAIGMMAATASATILGARIAADKPSVPSS